MAYRRWCKPSGRREPKCSLPPLCASETCLDGGKQLSYSETAIPALDAVSRRNSDLSDTC